MLCGIVVEAKHSLNQPGRMNMSNHVYKKVELIGSSKTSVTEAIETAISRASKTMRNLEWFEVDQIRGHIKDGAVEHYQVVVKVGFRIDD
jgi:flavin-binding protein dodecin